MTRSACRLRLRHPDLMSCGTCKQWLLRADGTPVLDGGGDPIRRENDGIPTPCASCPRVPVWAKKAGKPWRELQPLAFEPTPQVEQLLRFHLTCVAVSRWPADPLVDHFALIVREEIDAHARDRQDAQTAAIQTVIQLAMKKK